MTVYFHGNFGLNREYMAGVLRAGLRDSGASADSIAKPFGYKAPFTARYKSWLNKTGLITANRGFELTPAGQVVSANDPELATPTTQWLLHHNLTGDEEQAEAWYYLGKEFLPSTKNFTVDDLREGVSMKLMPHDANHFGKNAPMIKVIARKMVQCYTEASGLGELGILSKESNGSYTVHQPKELGPWASASQLEKQYQ